MLGVGAACRKDLGEFLKDTTDNKNAPAAKTISVTCLFLISKIVVFLIL
jgi:hypothetical protein